MTGYTKKDMDFNVLVGQTITKFDGGVGDEGLQITTQEGNEYEMYHWQSCCEDVRIEDICGDIEDLIGTPIVLAEYTSNDESRDPEAETNRSFTWTFYKLATKKGYVTIRWLGQSNGYYGEEVNFAQIVWEE